LFIFRYDLIENLLKITQSKHLSLKMKEESIKRDLYPITVDSVIFGYSNSELQVALVERNSDPFKGMWAIPGGFMEGQETAEETAQRELHEETGIQDVYLEQFHVFTSHGRDPRGRSITVAFFALINSDNHHLIASGDASKAKWWPAYKIPKLAFKQNEMFDLALQALRVAMKNKPLAFKLLSQEFTLTELQHLYEQVFNIKMDKRNFRRKVAKMGFIRSCGYKKEGLSHRPAELFKYDAALHDEFLKENFF